ncbi:MAG TPA: hypothetical protein PLO61_07795 [Fimbriimonadaceae bacterium]|nr:hypothetical protein [Fimbriimonadaceae bacterium]HRJ32636.1 hypothetical protein [Fimbriimonadaceae bacterium]
MRHYNKKSIGWAILGVGLGVGAVWAGFEIERLMRVDPFARFRGQSAPPAIAVLLRDVRVKTYDGPRLVGKARIDEVQVSRDRRGLSFVGIRDGIFYTDQGTSFRFSATQGTYNTAAKVFEASGKTQIQNRDVDLEATLFQYSDSEGVIRVPGEMKGTYLKGALSAESLQYFPRDFSFQMGPVSWSGPLQATGQESAPPRKWDIRAESASRSGDTETFNMGRATDGEVIVKADVIRRDVKTDVVIATGNVRYFAKDMNLLCDMVTVFRRERRAVLEGNVQAFIKPEDQQKLEEEALVPLRPIVPPGIADGRPAPPQRTEAEKQLDDEVRSSANRRKYPIVATAGRIEYWYRRGQRRAVITMDPVAQQDLPGGRWRRVATPLAKWDGEKDLLRCESPPGVRNTFVENSLGDRFVAQWFEVSTKENDDTWSAGNIDGVFTSDDEDLNNRGGSTGGGSGGTTGGGGAPPPPALRGRIGG